MMMSIKKAEPNAMIRRGDLFKMTARIIRTLTDDSEIIGAMPVELLEVPEVEEEYSGEVDQTFINAINEAQEAAK